MFRVFGAIIFGAISLGRESQFAPDFGKAKNSAARIFALLKLPPKIDNYSTEGARPVRSDIITTIVIVCKTLSRLSPKLTLEWATSYNKLTHIARNVECKHQASAAPHIILCSF